MPGEHSIFVLESRCTCCGASSENNYQHDDDCLINVPVAYMQYWRDGYAMRAYVAGDTDESRIAYVMGLGLKDTHLLKEKTERERKLESLSQAQSFAQSLREAARPKPTTFPPPKMA